MMLPDRSQRGVRPNAGSERPIVLGVVGNSAAGKSTLSAGIAAILGAERCVTLKADDYHRYDRPTRRRLGVSALHPDAHYLTILEQHLRLLRAREPVLKPTYHHEHGSLGVPEYFAPRRFVIVEGLLGYASRPMRECYDVKIFLAPDERLRTRWKRERDTTRRGYTPEELEFSLGQRAIDAPRYVEPQHRFADLVIRFRPPLDGEPVADHQLDVDAVLRPTLPHPDLTAILDREQRDLHLELARDADGKPVDILRVAGRSPRPRAAALESLLWSLLPERSDDVARARAQLGLLEAYDPADVPEAAPEPPTSRALAFVQLLIAYYLGVAARDASRT